MKKLVLILFLIIISISSGAQRVMGYFPNNEYGDSVVVYGYWVNGIFQLSHCRTNSIGRGIYSNLYYLDINTCSMKLREAPTNVGVAPAANPAAIPPPPAPAERPAFVGSPS